MIDKIIWKVLLMVGGIVGSIISLIKLPEGFDNLNYWERSLQHAKATNSFLGRDKIRAEISDAESYLYLWGIILVVSLIIFIVGCVIKTDSNKPQ
ncbi:MAG: hypothetical protein ACI4XJ_05255 [Eubacteriales bacterium]